MVSANRVAAINTPIDDTDPIRKFSIDFGSHTDLQNAAEFSPKGKPIRNFSIDPTSSIRTRLRTPFWRTPFLRLLNKAILGQFAMMRFWPHTEVQCCSSSPVSPAGWLVLFGGRDRAAGSEVGIGFHAGKKKRAQRFGDRKSLSIARNHPKASQEFSEEFGPSTHKIKGFSKNSHQKVHPNFAKILGRQILGNTLSGPKRLTFGAAMLLTIHRGDLGLSTEVRKKSRKGFPGPLAGGFPKVLIFTGGPVRWFSGPELGLLFQRKLPPSGSPPVLVPKPPLLPRDSL